VHRRQPLVGIIYNPFTAQLYHAIHGKGAYLTTPPALSPFPGTAATATIDPTPVTRRLPLTPPRPGPLALAAARGAREWGTAPGRISR
jgi:fructose-1,6-bisphosphatase/inositol monophosphatase family enzyme